MKIKNLKSIALLLLCTMLNINYAWGAEGDTHDFAQTTSQVVNGGNTVASINIDAKSYPVKQVIVSGHYNKSRNGVNITVTVGKTSWGTQNVNGNADYEKTFSGNAETAAIVISFENLNTTSSGNGTFQVFNVRLIEGAGGGTTYTVSYFDTGGEADHGDYSASSTSVSSGSTVTLTATPDAGYKLSSWSVYKEGDAGTTVTVTNNQFTMPAYNVVVKGTFESKGCTDHYGNDVETATETSGQFGPIYPYYKFSTRQILYTKADLGLAAGKKGIIKSIYFKYGYTSAMTSKTNVDIYMVNSDITELSTSAGHYVTVTLPDKVYSGALNGSGEDVWNEIVLTTPFNYDGAGNLIVVIDDNSGACEASGSFVFNAHTTSTDYSQLATYNDYTNADPSAAATWTGATTSNIRPSTMFCIQEQDMVACTVTFNAGTGSCGTSSLTEPSAGAGVTLPSASHECLGWTFAGWKEGGAQASTTTAPTLFAAGTTYHPASNCVLYAVYMKASLGGATSSLTIYPDNYSLNNSYGSGVEKTGSVGAAPNEVSLGAHYIMNNNAGTPSGATAGYYMQSQASNANIYNKSAIPGPITQVVVTQQSNQAMALYCGSSQLMASDNTSTGQTPSGDEMDDVASATTMTWTVSASKNYRYFDIKKGSGTSYIRSIEITYSSATYTYNSNPTCTDPELEVSTPSINFGTQNITSETDETITVRGINLTAGATLTISGTNADMFQVDPTSLAIDGSGKITGTNNVIVTYYPTASGDHTATLTVSSTTVGCADQTVTLIGRCEIICTSPTITFDESTVYKIFGDADFTNPVTIVGNGLGAAVTYSSNNTEVATVNATTGVVHIVNANEEASPVQITVSIADASSAVACQNAASRYYTLIVRNRITWYLNGDEYTDGDPVTAVYENGTIASLPDTPDGESACGGKTFMGWTTSTVDEQDTPPSPLYKTADAIPAITANTDFHAVFADEGSGGGSPTLIKMATGDTFEDGDTIVIVAHGTTKALYQQTVNSSYVSGWEFDGSAATVKADAKKSLGVAATEGGWYLGDVVSETNLFLNMGSSNSLYCDGDKTVWTLTDNGNGTFCLTSNSTKLSWRSDLGTPRWRGGNNNGVNTLDIYKFSPDGKTYENYSTSCGICLYPPTPTVAVQSETATLTWSAMPDATSYTITCSSGAEATVTGTTYTITGLSSLTDYTFTIKSNGTTPYTCFPKYKGSFKTADCDDVPVLGVVNTTSTTASISWTCTSPTATLQVFTDEECTNENKVVDRTTVTSPQELNGLTSGTTYYYKVLSGGTCSSMVGSFSTEELQLDITEWRENAVVISFNGDADLTLSTYNEVTHGDPHGNVAQDIFFSKYYEAAGGVKLLGIFNGTLTDYDLSNYKLGMAQSKETETAFAYTAFKNMIKSNGDKLSADELLLEPNEEIILITYGEKNTTDTTIIKCAKDNAEESGYNSYIKIKTPSLSFNGDDVLALVDPSDNFIDLIGAGTKAGGSDHSGTHFRAYGSGTTDKNGFMDYPGGWYTKHGYQVLAENAEASEYPLSSNRCLLIRRKFVKSGHNAVLLNTEDFVTLGDTTIGGVNHYEGEWKGLQIPGNTSSTNPPSPGIVNSCTGFEEVGKYNYNEYYTEFEPEITSQSFDDFKSNPFDGTYVIPVAHLDTMACRMVRIELKDGSDNLVIRKDVKVPIMVNGDFDTTDTIFINEKRPYRDADVCKECDVVVFKNAVLTKATDGTTNDADEVRNVKVYDGGKLIVPTGTHYTINSLAMRREEDAISLADIQGTLDIGKDKGVSLDLRIDPSNWHYVSLPYDCNVSEITFADGTPATPEVDFLLRWYDGASRAANKTGGWTPITSGVLRKGMGFVCGLPGTDIIKKELRFPMANDVIADEENNKTVTPVYGYGCDKSDEVLTPNHKGWNLIGNPYLMYYASDLDDPLDVGELYIDGYTYKRRGSLKYLVTPNDWNGRSGYSQVAINTHMKPFTAYFVQIGGANPKTAQNIVFHVASAGQNSIVRRRMPSEEYSETEDTHPVWFGLTFTAPNEEKDNTALLISNDFTDDYDMMDDLIKMRGQYYNYSSVTTQPIIASRNIKGEMAFNALPDQSAAETGVPLNYYAPKAGSYTISIDRQYKLDEVKSAMLKDATTNEYYDLLESDYTFNTSKGDNRERFTLYVRVERKKAPEVATDIEDVVDSNEEAPRKFLFNGTIYIQRGNAIYDITGKQLR